MPKEGGDQAAIFDECDRKIGPHPMLSLLKAEMANIGEPELVYEIVYSCRKSHRYTGSLRSLPRVHWRLTVTRGFSEVCQEWTEA